MNFPPQDFEQLRKLVTMLRHGEIDLPFGKKSFHALEAMIEDADVVAMSNIVELGQKINLSSASITRLAKLLGYKGFQQFQLIFKQKSKITNSFYSDGVNRLLTQEKVSAKQLLKQQNEAVANNIEQSIELLDDDALAKATDLLVKKNRIHIFAYRHSAAIANILRYGLALLRPNVQMLVQEAHGVAIALGQLKKDDLLVVIGSSPYSNVTLKIASIAKKQQCQILAITDSKLSPLNELATAAITIPSSKHFYTNSLVSSCFFIEGLLSLTAIELGNTAVNHVKHHEQLLSQLEVSS
jgi:DNA-binding MurR/RpiR family transcriptional regulator